MKTKAMFVPGNTPKVLVEEFVPERLRTKFKSIYVNIEREKVEIQVDYGNGCGEHFYYSEGFYTNGWQNPDQDDGEPGHTFSSYEPIFQGWQRFQKALHDKRCTPLEALKLLHAR